MLDRHARGIGDLEGDRLARLPFRKRTALYGMAGRIVGSMIFSDVEPKRSGEVWETENGEHRICNLKSKLRSEEQGRGTPSVIDIQRGSSFSLWPQHRNKFSCTPDLLIARGVGGILQGEVPPARPTVSQLSELPRGHFDV